MAITSRAPADPLRQLNPARSQSLLFLSRSSVGGTWPWWADLLGFIAGGLGSGALFVILAYRAEKREERRRNDGS
jgi:hypothetical protein